ERALARRLEAGAGDVTRTLDEVAARLGQRSPPRGLSTTDARARAGRLLSLARARGDAEAARTVGRAMLEISRQTRRVLEEARVVLTTFARLTVHEELRSLRYATLLIDEASTAPLPYVVYAAALAAERAAAVGDFQQLPPVVASSGPAAARWLRRDLFRETGVVTVGERADTSLPSPSDGLCAMLDVQYRMRPDIRALVSEFFYAGRLKDADGIASGRRSPPFEPGVLLLDTSDLDPTVERIDGSRRNRCHAEVIRALLAEVARRGEADVAVVSPYRAQTRLLRDTARRGLGRAAPAELQVSTIHRFQGREKRIVVFDTVDAPPGRSWFLDERRNPDFPRLLNVALSRARDGLVLVGSVQGLRLTLPPDALLHRLLEHVQACGGRVEARSWDGGAVGKGPLSESGSLPLG
ncbi:MAG: AAA domain-containing protein, partial [Gemmatimonadota bacterium]|nr:AAA domain-containing protein [Gemmatimonadota bacterium]